MKKSDEILARMHQLHPKLIDLSLDRLIALLDNLGNPQNKLPRIIHIAGTNGKGSTLAHIRAMLEAHGKNVHAYTSPHLVDFHERISLANGNGTHQDISEEKLVEILEEILHVNNDEPITFFEITTAVGFMAFAQNPADFLILEVGLGGRFDATNVIDKPELSIITPVSMDHTQFLGDNIAKIAFEKAGIIKNNVPVIIGPQDAEAYDQMVEVATSKNAPVTSYGVEYQAYEERGRLIYQNLSELHDLPLSNLLGAHQIKNAATAITASKLLLADAFDEANINAALKKVTWPARFQNITDTKLADTLPAMSEIWLDGGHNQAGGAAIAQQLKRLRAQSPKPLYLICAMMNSKEAGDFLSNFSDLNAKTYCLTIEGEENSFSADELLEMAEKVNLDTQKSDHFLNALKDIAEQNQDAVRVLICGSLYQAGNVLAHLKNA